MYLFFGAATTAVNWIIYILLVSGFKLSMTIGNAVAWVGAVLFAFITNKKFVFKSRQNSSTAVFKEGILFFLSRAFSGVFEILLPLIIFKIGLDAPLFGIEGFAAKAITTVFIILMNYILSKLVVFRKKSR